jgi:capsular polysaccharide transport system permease protein
MRSVMSDLSDAMDKTLEQPAPSTLNPIEPKTPMIEEIELTPLNIQGELVVADEQDAGDDRKPFFVRHALFMATVVLPLAIAALYYLLIASDRYVSEARFIVRSSAGNGVGGVATMIENQGLSRANDETYAVNDYVVSRDIVELLVRNNHLRDILARPEADAINRFPNFYSRDNKENLFERYKDMVQARIDSATGISTLKVAAFRADDATGLASAIIKYAEDLINRLNERAYDDAERYAQTIVDRERNGIGKIETDLTTFRNANGSVDPGKEAVAGFEMIGKMTTELVLLEANLQQQLALSPGAPGIAALREKIRSYQEQIDKQKLDIVGGNRSLASKLAGYERLELDRELAARALGLAMINLAKAREDAQQQHLYLQTIVVPNVADYAEYPRRTLGMFLMLLVCLGLYATVRSLSSITLEHRA